MTRWDVMQDNVRLLVIGNLARIYLRLPSRSLLKVTFIAWAFPAFAQDTAAPAANSTFAYVITGGVAIAIIIGLGTIRSALSGSRWSLSDALSEEADVSLLDKDGKPIPGPDGKPQTISVLCASSSRFIALIGLVGILMIYLGFGLVILAAFASTGALPTHDQFMDIVYLLFAGVTMFAPYIVNKFSSVFDWLKPAKQ